MKPLLALFLCSAFICGCKDQSESQTNRFQIVAGKYAMHGVGGGTALDSMFKVDTVTGKAWIYRSVIGKEDGLKHGWQEIPEFENALSSSKTAN